MSSIRPPQFTILIAAFAILMAGCDTTAAGSVSVFNGDTGATAQADQYHRDAAATETQRAVALEQNIRNLQATDTAVAFTATSVAATSTAGFQAILNTTATAAYQATRAEEANRTATAESDANKTATAKAEATAATVQATETQMALDAQQSELAQQKVVTATGWTLLFVFGTVFTAACLYVFVRSANVIIAGRRKRDSVIATGPNGVNPLAVVESKKGLAIINPLAMTSGAMTVDQQSGQVTTNVPVDPSVQAHIFAMFLAYMQQLAQQGVYPPPAPIVAVEKFERTKTGGVERESRTTPIGLASAPGTRAVQLTPPQTGQGAQTPLQIAPRLNDPAQLPLPIGEVEVVEGRWQEVPATGVVANWVSEAEHKLLEEAEDTD
jgi:hypothetical protein